MPIPPGTYALGPGNGSLSVRTGRTGAAAKAGHDLLIEVAAWEATLEIAEEPAGSAIALRAESASLRVLEGSGGMQPLGDDDRASIEQTISDEILHGSEIAFRSTGIETGAGGTRLDVRGELTLVGTTAPIEFGLAVDADCTIRGSAVVRQSDWGIAPYSALFGTLKVVDEVEVAVEANPLTEPTVPIPSYELIRPRALEPALLELAWISRTTMVAHHRLYEGYVDSRNEILGRLATADPASPELRALKVELAAAVNGIKSHEVYFGHLGGDGGEPGGTIAELIRRDFGSAEAWRSDLKRTALAARAWAWTAYDWDEGRLVNCLGDSQAAAPRWNATPLVALDVDEHAYFLDFQTDRAAYVDALFDNLDWAAVGAWVAAYRIPAAQSR